MQEQETMHAVMVPLDDDSIKSRILTIRGVQVILDRDIAFLYGVETKVLNQAVKRNRERFPDRFMFQLTEEELGNWKSQIVTSNPSLEQTIKMGVRRAPYAFTEQGVAMLSAVLKSETAIRVSIQIMDAFSAMRRALASIAPILSRLDVVERRQITDQQRNEERFDTIFKAMDGGDFPPQKVFLTASITTHILLRGSWSARRRRTSSSWTTIATMSRSISFLKNSAVRMC